MAKIILAAIGIAVAALLLYAATRPGTFHIQRTVLIDASPSAIFPYMSDFHKGRLWVPYETKDPQMKRTFSGPDHSQGAVYEFEGHNNIGKGRLEIIEAMAPNRVVLTLDMIKPMEGHNRVEYTIRPEGSSSRVSWSMSGSCPCLGKLMGIFFNADKMMGEDFSSKMSTGEYGFISMVVDTEGNLMRPAFHAVKGTYHGNRNCKYNTVEPSAGLKKKGALSKMIRAFQLFSDRPSPLHSEADESSHKPWQLSSQGAYPVEGTMP